MSLTIWKWQPHWRPGSTVTERLEYLTSVVVSQTGIEYRERLRLHPRRGADFSILEVDHDFCEIDAALWGTEIDGWLMPLWWDVVAPAFGSSGGWSGTGLTDHRDFRSGGQVVATDGSDWQAFTVDAVASGGITVEETVPNHLRSGVRIFPAYPAALSPAMSRDAVSAGVGEARVSMDLIDYTSPDGDDLDKQWRDFDVLEQRPDRGVDISADYTRAVTVTDYRTGPVTYHDTPNSPTIDRSRRYVYTDREAIWTHRLWWQKMGGRHGEFFAPTANKDLDVIDVTGGDLVVRTLDWGANYDGREARKNVWIRLRDGATELREIEGSTISGDEETLALNESLNVSASDIAQVCWLEAARLSSDVVEVEWINAHAATVALSTRTLIDEPVPEDPASFFSVEIDEQSSTLEPAEDAVVTVFADIENTGNIEDTQNVELVADGQVQDSQELTLGVGASDTVELTWDGAGTAGEIEITVQSDDDSDTATAVLPYALGGDEIYDITQGGQDWRVHEFHNSGDFEVLVENLGFQALLVGGGGPGGVAQPDIASGGGGGGSVISWPSSGTFSMDAGVFSVSVGQGGLSDSGQSGAHTDGTDTFLTPSSGIPVASRGGYGGYVDEANQELLDGESFDSSGPFGGPGGGMGAQFSATDGGTVVGANVPPDGGDGSSESTVNGDTGWSGGGGAGGGESIVGEPFDGDDGNGPFGGDGGDGVQSDITGTLEWYGGGGGGAAISDGDHLGDIVGEGGQGGGGAGGRTDTGGGRVGRAGEDGKGGGGGGGCDDIGTGGDGGKGIVICRYKI